MTSGFDFNHQAAAFDQRAGLPADATRAIATAILETSGDPGTILDLGAGTGEVGTELARTTARNSSTRYLALDLSLSMLAVFRRKLEGAPSRGVTLLQADADRPWPVRNQCISVFFFSRSAHLLRPAHLVAQVLRTAQPGGASLVVGRIRREKGSVRALMRRRMRQALEARGVEGKAGEVARNRLLTILETEGGRALEPRRVASWPLRERPIESLAAWSRKNGLAGLALPVDFRREVLAEVETWAKEMWSSLDTVHESTEHYELTTVQLP